MWPSGGGRSDRSTVTTAPRCSKPDAPRILGGHVGNIEGVSGEADLATKAYPPASQARFPSADGDPWRTRHPQAPASTRTCAPDRLTAVAGYGRFRGGLRILTRSYLAYEYPAHKATGLSGGTAGWAACASPDPHRGVPSERLAAGPGGLRDWKASGQRRDPQPRPAPPPRDHPLAAIAWRPRYRRYRATTGSARDLR